MKATKCKSSVDDPLLAKALGAGVLPKVQKKGNCKVTMASATLPEFPKSRWAKGPKPSKPRAKKPKPQKPREESPKPAPKPRAKSPKLPQPSLNAPWRRVAANEKPWWDLPVERPAVVVAAKGNARSYIIGYPKGMEKKTLIVESTAKQSPHFEEFIKRILERIRDKGLSKSQCREYREALLAA